MISQTSSANNNVQVMADSSDGSSSPSSGLPQQSLVSEDAFLQLLVAQLKNQSPDNPSDGTQFVTELAQFTDLEQVVNIRTDVGAIKDFITGTTSNDSGSGSGSGSASGS